MTRIVEFVILLNGLLGIATYLGIKLVVRKGKNMLIQREPEYRKDCVFPECVEGERPDFCGHCGPEEMRRLKA